MGGMNGIKIESPKKDEDKIKELIREAITLSGGMYGFMDILDDVSGEDITWLRDFEFWCIKHE
jgi:hypothetical protein